MYEFKTGKLVGTGAEIKVDLGFVPSYVKVFNLTETTTTADVYALEWFEGMTANHSLQYSILTGAATGGANVAKITSGGILPVKTENTYDGEGLVTAGITGFSIPAAFQAASDELYYIAVREV